MIEQRGLKGQFLLVLISMLYLKCVPRRFKKERIRTTSAEREIRLNIIIKTNACDC